MNIFDWDNIIIFAYLFTIHLLKISGVIGSRTEQHKELSSFIRIFKWHHFRGSNNYTRSSSSNNSRSSPAFMLFSCLHFLLRTDYLWIYSSTTTESTYRIHKSRKIAKWRYYVSTSTCELILQWSENENNIFFMYG